MPGIGIVTNPNSRRNRRNPEQVKRLGYILGDSDSRHELTKHPDDIRKVAERFKENGVEVLALNGGDGTNHVTLSTFIDVYGETPLPLIAFLRGGTMNTISNAIGIKGTPGKIVLRIAENYHLGEPFEISERDLLKVEHGEQVHYGFIFGNGLIYNFLDAYYNSGNPSPWVGFTTLVRGALSGVIGGSFAKQLMSPFKARVTVDGEVWERREFKAVLASSIEQLGLGFRPFTRCRETPGKFNLLAVIGSTPRFVMQLPRARVGKLMNPSVITSDVASDVLFESEEPIPFIIDGDMHHSEGPVRLSTVPRLRIIIK